MLNPVTYIEATGLLSGLKLQCYQGSMYTTRENWVCQFVGEIVGVMKQVRWGFLELSEPDATLLNWEASRTREMDNAVQPCFGLG